MYKVMNESLSNWILFVLSRAEKLEATINKVKLQKILFLMKEELGLDVPANFKPFKFNPYSIDIDKALKELEKRGDIEINVVTNKKDDIYSEEEIKASKKYEIELPEGDLSYLDKLITMPTTELLAYVYIKFPQYTKRAIYLKKFSL
jgi:uncharacterized protein YwgA